MKSGVAALGVIVCLFVGGAARAHSADCTTRLFKNADFTEELTDFSPHDRVFVVVDCLGIPSGTHVMHANWVHATRGLVRTNSYEFFQEQKGKRSLYFWFKLNRRGPLSSALSNQDFSESSLGAYGVEVFLNDQPVGAREFSINP